jgi:DNA-binding MarR family transcriptional regulator
VGKVPGIEKKTMDVSKRLGLRIRRAMFALRRLLMSRLAPLGVTHEQYLILLYLDEEDGITQKELARRSFTNPNTVTDIVRHLEAGGFVRRSTDQDDRRALRVQITPKGRAFRERLIGMANEITDQVLAGLSSADRQAFLRGLDVVAEAAEQSLQNSRERELGSNPTPGQFRE